MRRKCRELCFFLSQAAQGISRHQDQTTPTGNAYLKWYLHKLTSLRVALKLKQSYILYTSGDTARHKNTVCVNSPFLSPISSRFNHSIKDWQYRQMWLFVLCQEQNSDINYQCWLHWHLVKKNKVVDLCKQTLNVYFCCMWVRMYKKLEMIWLQLT
jgi:hypothetical protein